MSPRGNMTRVYEYKAVGQSLSFTENLWPYSVMVKKTGLNIGPTNMILKKHRYKESDLSSAHSLSLVFFLILSEK